MFIRITRTWFLYKSERDSSFQLSQLLILFAGSNMSVEQLLEEVLTTFYLIQNHAKKSCFRWEAFTAPTATFLWLSYSWPPSWTVLIIMPKVSDLNYIISRANYLKNCHLNFLKLCFWNQSLKLQKAEFFVFAVFMFVEPPHDDCIGTGYNRHNYNYSDIFPTLTSEVVQSFAFRSFRFEKTNGDGYKNL